MPQKTPMASTLSKSKILSFRQCPKRLWLEVRHPDLIQQSAATEATFRVGHQVGEIARQIYDVQRTGALINLSADGLDGAFARTRHLLQSSQPIFEGGFQAGGVRAFADVLLPVRKGGKTRWRMVEVKSSASVKDYHRDDAAVQTFVARCAGVALASVAVAHIDSKWVYPGGGDYRGLLKERDLTEEVLGRGDEVQGWIGDAQVVLRKRKEPEIRTGAQCNDPYACGFIDYCTSQEPQAEHPVHWLPRVQTKALKTFIAENFGADLRDVPDALLNITQRRVKDHTLSGQVYFDTSHAKADLAGHGLPACFMDFETINPAVPIWKGTSPFQQVPFQFSVHRMARNGKLTQEAFLDLSGNDPSKAFAEALVAACGESGPVFVYSASFERSRIKDLAAMHPRLARPLLAINERMVDLRPVAEQRYYHPRQQGSWSIKAVLPAIAPDLSYDRLDGVQDGGMAMEAYFEAIDPCTSTARKAQIEHQLLNYCALDTLAMVRLWQFFTGRSASA